MEKLLKKAMERVDEAELFLLESAAAGVGFSAGKLKDSSSSQSLGVALRVIKNGRMGYATSSNMEALDDLLDQAVTLAEHGQEVPFGFSGPAEMAELDLFDPRAGELDVDALVIQGRRMVSTLLDYDPGLSVFAGLGAGWDRVRILTSHGLDAEYRTSSFSLGAGAQLVETGNILTVYDTYMGLEPWTDEQVGALGQNCVELLRLGRKTVTTTGGPKKVILTPDAMADIFLTFEEGINGLSIAKGTSPLIGKLGQEILNPKVTILDDGLRPDGPGSCPFDDEGVPSRCTPIVEKGVLRSYLTDRKSAAQTELPLTGNGLRHTSLIREKSFTSSPAPEARNLVLQPGQMSLEEMLAATDDGLYIKAITGILLGNLINGDFSGNVELGFLVRNGEKLGRVKNVMIAGNFYDLFGSQLLAVGSDPIWTGNFGGESGSYSLPHTFFDGVSISA